MLTVGIASVVAGVRATFPSPTVGVLLRAPGGTTEPCRARDEPPGNRSGARTRGRSRMRSGVVILSALLVMSQSLASAVEAGDGPADSKLYHLVEMGPATHQAPTTVDPPGGIGRRAVGISAAGLAAPTTAPNDPLWDMTGAADICLPEAWGEVPPVASEVIVAVVDSGVDATHPDLVGRVVAGYDFIDNDETPQDTFGHGTFIAGIIAAVGDNGIGIAGVAPEARIMPVRVIDRYGMGTEDGIADGIRWATEHGARVINLSLGGFYSDPIAAAIDEAIAAGVVVIAAAGNDGSPEPMFPASYAPVIAVGATHGRALPGARFLLTEWSDWGVGLDVVAPGEDIVSTVPLGVPFNDSAADRYVMDSGTSYSAAYASGIAALLIARGMDPMRLVSAALPGSGSPRTSVIGSGVVNACAALGLALPARFADREPPVVSWGLGSSPLARGIVTVAPSAVDSVGGVASLDLWRSIGYDYERRVRKPAPAIAPARVDSTRLPDGLVSWNVTAFDTAGNGVLQTRWMLVTNEHQTRRVSRTRPFEAGYAEARMSVHVGVTSPLLVLATASGLTRCSVSVLTGAEMDVSGIDVGTLPFGSCVGGSLALPAGDYTIFVCTLATAPGTIRINAWSFSGPR